MSQLKLYAMNVLWQLSGGGQRLSENCQKNFSC